MAGITGDFATVKEWIKSLDGLKTATKTIAAAALPKLKPLVSAEFSSGTDPYGAAWQPKVDGSQPFAGSDADGRVQMRLVAGGTIIRTTVAYPMHFHQDGTRGGGRKSARKLRASLRKAGHDKASQKAAVEKMRASAGQRLPARPIIPTDEAGGIPQPWTDALTSSARDVMAKGGAR